MRLDRVTITGADDSIHPEALAELSREFPFVEWGILVSFSNTVSLSPNAIPRFPSLEWIGLLTILTESKHLQLSLHLCGAWVRDLLLGCMRVPSHLRLATFQRIQLIFHAENTPCKPEPFARALRSMGRRQYIFQIDGAHGNAHLETLVGMHTCKDDFIDAVPLFDISGGAGIVPSVWPRPEYLEADGTHCYHGYAGGLGPENLEQQLPLIAQAAGNARIWIDMETRVRSQNDRQFDLAKVRSCLEICRPFISPPG